MGLDRPAPAFERPVRVGFALMRRDLGDRAEQRVDQRHRMHAEIVERAMARRAVALEAERRPGVGHEILVHLDPDMVDPADRARGQQMADLPDHRILDVVVPKDRDATRHTRRIRHALRIGEAGRHRLFAPHMLARLERGDRHLGVELVGRRDRHHVDRRIVDQRPPIGPGPGKTELAGAPRGKLVGHLRQVGEPHDRAVAEHRVNRRPRERVALSHVPRPDQSDADCLHDPLLMRS